jgi:hypothetical protein
MATSDDPPHRSLASDLWTNLQHVSEWVRFADTKAAAILTIDGILATVLVTTFAGSDHPRSTALSFTLCVTAVCVAISGGMSMACLLPRLTIGQADNKVYFAGISRFQSGEDYLAALRGVADEGNFDIELARETWSRSRAAVVKYRYIRRALFALSGALVASGVIGILVLTGG